MYRKIMKPLKTIPLIQKLGFLNWWIRIEKNRENPAEKIIKPPSIWLTSLVDAFDQIFINIFSIECSRTHVLLDLTFYWFASGSNAIAHVLKGLREQRRSPVQNRNACPAPIVHTPQQHVSTCDDDYYWNYFPFERWWFLLRHWAYIRGRALRWFYHRM